MSRKNSIGISFEGKHFFCGIDVDTKHWDVVVRTDGIEVKKVSMDPDPETMVKYLRRMFPGGIYHTVYEAGYCGFGAHRQLTALGCDSRVTHAADVPTTDKEKESKSNRIDARKLARGLENGELKAIYVPTEKAQHLRTLVRHWNRCTRSTTRVQQRIKALLYYYSIDFRQFRKLSGPFIAWLERLPLDGGLVKQSLKLHLDELRQHRERIVTIQRELRTWCKTHEDWELLQILMTIPGIGFKTAIVLYTEIIDMHRFPSLDEVKSFVGLRPSMRGTGDHVTILGLTRRRNRYLRHIMIEAAWASLRSDPALVAYYCACAGRMKRQAAIVLVAKKLLNRIRYVWMHRTPYQCSLN